MRNVSDIFHMSPIPLHAHQNILSGEVGPGGAAHEYVVHVYDRSDWDEPDGVFTAKTAYETSIHFQEGPLGTTPPNGLSSEAVLVVLIDHLQGFQNGPYACRENACAITHLQEALHWLQHRQYERLRRGVQGELKS